MDNKVITNSDNTKVIGFVIDGKTYKRRNNEDYNKFYNRVSKKAQRKDVDLTSILTSQNFKKERQKVKEVKEGSKQAKRLVAIATIITLLGTGATLYSCGKDKKVDNTNTKKQELNIDEENQALNEAYQKFAKYEDGQEIVDTLEKIDDASGRINPIAINNPDANGKESIIYAEELAAISDVYNSNTKQKTLLENAEEIRCNYFQGQAALINLSQGSRDVQEIDNLFTNNKLSKKQQEIQNATQETLDNLNVATPEFIDMLNDVYKTRGNNPELQSEVAFGQAGLAAALTPEMTGETLENYQIASKTEGGQLNELVNDAAKDSKRFAVEDNEINIEKQQDINDALKAIDAKYNLDEYDRTDYDPSTTEKGKEMIKAMYGDVAVTAGGEVVVKSKTTHEYRKATRSEAAAIIGEDKLKDLEDKVKVDTDGDGKNDTAMDKANEESKKEATEKAKTWADGYEAGQIAFTNGGSSTTNAYNASYQSGYAAGYKHAKEVYDEQSKNDYEEENFVYEKQYTAPTTPSVPSQDEEYVFEDTFVEETQKVKSVERAGEVYETPEPTTSKVRSYSANA